MAPIMGACWETIYTDLYSAALFTTPLLGNEKFDDDYVRRCVELLGDLPLSPLWHLPILTEEKEGEKPKKKKERVVPYTPSAPSY